LFSTCYDGAFNVYNCMYGKKNEQLYVNFDRTFNAIYKIYASESEAISISNKREMALWDIASGKITETVKIKEKGLAGYINKLKYNRAENSFLLLTDRYELGLFKNFDLVNKVVLAKRDEYEKRLCFVDMNAFESNMMNQMDHLTVLNRANYECFKVKWFDLDAENDEVAVERLVLNTSNNEDSLAVFSKELNCLFLINKQLERFKVCSYDSKPGSLGVNKSDEKPNTTRFLFKNDQKQLKMFYSLYELGIYEYKVIFMDGFDFYFVVTVRKPKIGNEETELIQQKSAVNNIIIKARIVTTVNRRDQSVEMEIVKVYPFVRNYQLLKRCQSGIRATAADELIVCFNVHVDLDMDLVRDKAEFNLTYSPKDPVFNHHELVVMNVTRGVKLFNLKLDTDVTLRSVCVDPRMEYVVAGDDKKLVSLFRVSDARQLAHMPLYGEIGEMRFSSDSRFVCLSMNDRRVLSLLLVDPSRPGHVERIRELPTRKTVASGSSTRLDDLNSILEDEEREEDEEGGEVTGSRSTSASNKKNVDSTDESENSDDEIKEQAYMVRRDRLGRDLKVVSKKDRDNEFAAKSWFNLFSHFPCLSGFIDVMNYFFPYIILEN
jgi:hypothetical protein